MVDTSQLHYYGNSLGGILGDVYMASTTDVIRGNSQGRREGEGGKEGEREGREKGMKKERGGREEGGLCEGMRD